MVGPLGFSKAILHLGRAASNRNDSTRVLTDVFGDFFLGVISPHLLLINVFFEYIAEHIGVDFVPLAQRAFVQVPLPLTEEIEDALERLVTGIWISSP